MGRVISGVMEKLAGLAIFASVQRRDCSVLLTDRRVELKLNLGTAVHRESQCGFSSRLCESVCMCECVFLYVLFSMFFLFFTVNFFFICHVYDNYLLLICFHVIVCECICLYLLYAPLF